MMYDQSVWELNVMREFYKLKAIDYTDKAKAWNTTLTSSSSDEDWLQAAIKVICYENPNVQFGVFHGYLKPNSAGYFEVMIYATPTSQSHSLPQYCLGTWRKYGHTYCTFCTNNYAFEYKSLVPGGRVYEASKSVTISSTDINNDTDGASVSLPAGTYVVIGQWQFNTRSTTGSTNSAVRLLRSGSTSPIAQTRVSAASYNWNSLQCSAIVNLTQTETLKVCGATSRPYTSAVATWIKAIKIL